MPGSFNRAQTQAPQLYLPDPWSSALDKPYQISPTDQISLAENAWWATTSFASMVPRTL